MNCEQQSKQDWMENSTQTRADDGFLKKEKTCGNFMLDELSLVFVPFNGCF